MLYVIQFLLWRIVPLLFMISFWVSLVYFAWWEVCFIDIQQVSHPPSRSSSIDMILPWCSHDWNDNPFGLLQYLTSCVARILDSIRKLLKITLSYELCRSPKLNKIHCVRRRFVERCPGIWISRRTGSLPFQNPCWSPLGSRKVDFMGFSGVPKIIKVNPINHRQNRQYIWNHPK